MNFNTFLGIDQTGAVGPRGEAKPMPVACIRGDVLTTSWIKHFSFEALGAVAPLVDSTAILVDCVFGLPASTWPDEAPAGQAGLESFFKRAAARPGYGLQAAAEYFDEFRANEYPVRECEILARANSVFRTRPYQRNIQCGTYRIWRDLGRDTQQDWFNVAFFSEGLGNRPWIFEAYPSLFWRQELRLPTRQPALLEKTLREVAPGLKIPSLKKLVESPDMADAIVLAVGGWLLQKRKALVGFPVRDREGWIAGLEESP